MLTLASCRKGSMWGVRGEGDNITENRTVSGISAINLSVDANITYVQDSVYSLEVSGQKNILAILDTRVEGGELRLDFKRNVWDHNRLNLIVHSPQMNKINISGSGNVEVSNRINGSHLDLQISGSGNITVPTVSLQSIDVKMSGSGSINVRSGVCSSEYFSISGSGEMNCEFVNATNATAKISGSGNIVLSASGTLNVDISGSGSVKYRGSPAVTSNISGSGKLIHLN